FPPAVEHRHVPETHDPTATGPVDVLGAALSSVGLPGSPSRSSLAPTRELSRPRYSSAAG
ncbi:MAG: hypothetical protein LC749_03645, partial [Actinobacteria bacterium]|nr:hypothetical protein [Actinomycetota bacterium]